MRSAFCDFIASKVKILSFFAYISRSFVSSAKSFSDKLPSVVIDLLDKSPADSLSIRKELLIATRHILSTELRTSFIKHIDALVIEEKILGSSDCPIFYSLRPLAFSMVADFLHHVRQDLAPDVIGTLFHYYCSMLHDQALPLSMQIMLVKLILNLLEVVLGDRIEIQSRCSFLNRAFSSFVLKVKQLSEVIAALVKSPLQSVKEHNPLVDLGELIAVVNGDFASTANADSGEQKGEQFKESAKGMLPCGSFVDIKHLLRLVFSGLKSIVVAIKAASRDSPDKEALLFDEAVQLDLLIQLYRDGLGCFQVLTPIESSLIENVNSSVLLTNTMPTDEKELLDVFSYLFTILEQNVFQDIICSQLQHLFDSILGNISLLAIPQYFLAISGISRNFSSVLVRFLSERVCMLGSDDHVASMVVLRLFKLLFLAVSVYPEDNESMLLPFLSPLIAESIRKAKHSAVPLNFYLMLRSLFRSIGGGRFELLYKEVQGLLPFLLEEFNYLLSINSNSPIQNEIYIELCLTIPVRLSVLLPHLRFLMRPLVFALRSGLELRSQGMRTLELCIDNLMQDFMEPLMSSVLEQMISSLFSILQNKDNSPSHAISAIRILGKLGGRSRKYNTLKLSDAFCRLGVLALRLRTGDNSASGFDVFVDRFIVLCKEEAAEIKRKAVGYPNAGAIFGFLESCLCAFLSFSDSESSFLDAPTARSATIHDISQIYLDHMDDELHPSLPHAAILQSGHLQKSEQFSELLCIIVDTLFELLSFPLVATSVLDFLHGYLEKLLRSYVTSLSRNNRASFVFHYCPVIFEASFQKACELPARLFLKMLDFFEHSLAFLKSSLNPQQLFELPLIHALADKFIEICYSADVPCRVNACVGLRIFYRSGLDLRWLWIFEARLLKALFFVLKSSAKRSRPDDADAIAASIMLVIDNSVTRPSFDEDLLRKRAFYSNVLLSFLVSELTCQNTGIAAIAQQCIGRFALSNKAGVADLLSPFKEKLLGPIFAKPLRALPFSLQIGYINAVDYCLTLETPLVSLDDDILRFIHEALALADADEQSLTGKSVPANSSDIIDSLRVVSLKLLATSLTFSEFQQVKLQQIRNHIVSIFFKSLYSKSPAVVEIARKGLEKIILHQHKLPKDLMQSGLRPVLTNLTDAKRLTVPSLEGLCRLLKLLTSYFKPEIGRKMLEHIQAWADPHVLKAASDKPLCEFNELNIIEHLVAVFPLLPVSANIFIPELVSQVVQIEKHIRRTISSPFRQHLLDYLVISPPQTIDFFLQNILDFSFARLLCDLLRLPNSTALIHECSARVGAFISAFESASAVVCRYLLFILKEISCYLSSSPSAIDQKGAIMDFLHAQFSKHSTEKLRLFSDADYLPLFDVCRSAILWMVKPLLSLELVLAILQHQSRSGVPASLSESIAAFLLKSSDGFLLRVIESLSVPLARYGSSSPQPPRPLVNSASRKLAIKHILIPCIIQLRTRGCQSKLVPLLLQMLERFFTSQFLDFEEKRLLLLLTSILCEAPQLTFKPEIIKNFSDVCRYPDAFCSVLSLYCLSLYVANKVAIPESTLLSLLRNFVTGFAFDLKGISSSLLPLIGRFIEQKAYSDAFVKVAVGFLNPDGQLTPSLSLVWYIVLHFQSQLSSHLEYLLPHLIKSFTRAGISIAYSFDPNLPFDLFNVIADRISQHSSPELFRSHIMAGTHLLFSFHDCSRDFKAFHARARPLLLLICRQCSEKSLTITTLNFLKQVHFSEALDDASLAFCITFVFELVTNFLLLKDDAGFVCELTSLQSFLEPFLAAHHFLVSDVFQAVVDRLFLLISKQEITSDVWILNMASSQIDSDQSFSLQISLLLGAARCAASHAASLRSSVLAFSGDFVHRAIERLYQAGSPSSKDRGSFKAILLKWLESINLLELFSNGSMLLPLLKELWKSSDDSDVILSIFRLYLFYAGRSLFAPEFSLLFTLPTARRLREDECSVLFEIVKLALSQSSAFLKHELALEKLFIQHGLLSEYASVRSQALELLLDALPNSSQIRLQYLISGQNWHVADDTWLRLSGFVCFPCLAPARLQVRDPLFDIGSVDASDPPSCLAKLVDALSQLIFSFPRVAHAFWPGYFSEVWALCDQVSRKHLTGSLEVLLSQPLPPSQAPVIQSVLDGIRLCQPIPAVTAELIGYSALNYCAWHSSCIILESYFQEDISSPSKFSSLASIYKQLSEQSLLISAHRIRSPKLQTSVIGSLLQIPLWSEAQKALEDAQEKLLSGAASFSAEDMRFFESQWISCAKKLQQWDLVNEIAKLDLNPLDSVSASWFLLDTDQSLLLSNISSTLDLNPSRFPSDSFQSNLLKSFYFLASAKDDPSSTSRSQEVLGCMFTSLLNDWSRLPRSRCLAHDKLMVECQQITEVQESQSLFASSANAGLSKPNAIQELKGVFGTWRDRIPNKWEDISVWADVFSFRQHIFSFVNRALNPALSEGHPSAGSQNAAHPYACRGFHELAWCINRFSKIARHNALTETALSALSRIYALPNIEVPEAFFKLREQAKCYMNKPKSLPLALDVINATNLGFFHTLQKAEFFALKADVMSRLGLVDEANRVFAQAVQVDLNLAKAWALWGNFNDQRFRQIKDPACAVNAINCYLQAATLVRGMKARKFLARLLWILSFDTPQGHLSSSFEVYNNDLPLWYWINLVSFLFTSLSRIEASTAQLVLSRLVKTFPQVRLLSYFRLSTSSSKSAPKRRRPRLQENWCRFTASSAQPFRKCQALPYLPCLIIQHSSHDASPSDSKRKASCMERLEEITSVCRTAHPLLSLSLENMIDHVSNRFRALPEEDLHRVISAIFSDAIQVHARL